ncbi:MAG: DUF2892 domain-containing protein [Halofilum sp. (in: g-proteobacteria)]|nr:DUF2892 domain-containing protein [Halofilum sp. (in: g-proteobacteria)]
MIAAGLGVSGRFLRLALGIAGLAAAYRLELPIGLLGLVLIASAIVGWCGLCEATGSAQWPQRARRASAGGAT